MFITALRRSRCYYRMLMCLIILLGLIAGVSAAVNFDPRRSIPVRFALDRSGYVTLVIEDAEGRRVRNLLADTWFEAGVHTVWWDGYDQGDKFIHPPKGPDSNKEAMRYTIRRRRVEPGSYQVRGLLHDDIKLRYLTPVHSPGTPPWHTLDGDRKSVV